MTNEITKSQKVIQQKKKHNYNQRKGNGWQSGKAICVDYKKIIKMINTKG